MPLSPMFYTLGDPMEQMEHPEDLDKEDAEIYMEECGCECPSLGYCPHRLENNCCGMEEPWYDCAAFIGEFWVEIQQAEFRVDAKREVLEGQP